MAEKIDFKKSLDSYQARKGTFRLLEVAEQHYLMVDGHGDPNASPGFAEAIETLYPVAYGLKFASKNDLGRDYVVPPLEGLWWAEDMASFTTARDKTRWSWTLMLLVPEWLGAADVEVDHERRSVRAGVEGGAADHRGDPLSRQPRFARAGGGPAGGGEPAGRSGASQGRCAPGLIPGGRRGPSGRGRGPRPSWSRPRGRGRRSLRPPRRPRAPRRPPPRGS